LTSQNRKLIAALALLALLLLIGIGSNTPVAIRNTASALDMTKPVYLAKGAITCPEYTVILQFMQAKLQESTNAAAAQKTADALFTPPLRHGCETVPERTMIRFVDDEPKIKNDNIVTVERINDLGNHLVVFGRGLQN
jgi:hypothetical protein